MNYNKYECFNRLDDESLLTINPRDNALDKNIITKIIEECKNNPFYFYRELAIIPSEYKYNIYPFNLAKIFCDMNNISTIDMNFRQSYKTITSLWILIYHFLFDTNFTGTIIGDNYTFNKHNIEYIHHILETLLFNYIDSNIVYKNDTIYNPYNNNRIIGCIYRVLSLEKDKMEDYDNVVLSRSLNDTNIIIFDDIAHRQDFIFLFNHLLPTIAKNKIVYHINTIYNDKSEFLEDTWYKVCHFKEKHYDYNLDQLHTILNNNFRYSNLMFIHFESEDILSKEKMKEIYYLIGKNKLTFRQEMCMYPFDELFDLDLYIEELEKE